MKFDGVNMSPEIDEDKLLDSLDENELLSHIVRMRRSVKEMYSGVESGSEEFVIAELAIMTYSSHRKLKETDQSLNHPYWSFNLLHSNSGILYNIVSIKTNLIQLF